MNTAALNLFYINGNISTPVRVTSICLNKIVHIHKRFVIFNNKEIFFKFYQSRNTLVSWMYIAILIKFDREATDDTY